MSQAREKLPPWVLSMVSGLCANAILAFLGAFAYLAGLRGIDYGFGIFVCLPTILGFMASVILEMWGQWKLSLHAITSIWTCFFGLLVAFVVYFEGVLCLTMALPLIYPLTFLGALMGYGLMRSIRRRQGTLLVSALVLAPLSLAVDSLRHPTPPTREISTEVVIHASPERIWPLLFNLEELPPADFWMFRMGIAHPTSVRTDHLGAGGNRFCALSTGEMPETIADYDQPRRFVFKVRSTPETMREWNPLGSRETPHLKNYFECLEGGFTLTRLPNGDTKLSGFTHYRHYYSPSAYWNLWTDKIVREVQWQVMSEIKRRAEK